MIKFAVLLMMISASAHAEVYKCTDAKEGGVKFQRNPCSSDPESHPMELRKASPSTLEKIKREALRQQIADEKWREENRKEEKHQAELNAISARAMADEQWLEYIHQQRVESAEREARWAHEDYCRTRTRINPSDGC